MKKVHRKIGSKIQIKIIGVLRWEMIKFTSLLYGIMCFWLVFAFKRKHERSPYYLIAAMTSLISLKIIYSNVLNYINIINMKYQKQTLNKFYQKVSLVHNINSATISVVENMHSLVTIQLVLSNTQKKLYWTVFKQVIPNRHKCIISESSFLNIKMTIPFFFTLEASHLI